MCVCVCLCVCVRVCRIALEMGAETCRSSQKRPLLLFDFNHNWNVSTYFNILPRITLNESPFCDTRVVTLGQTDGQEADRCGEDSRRILLQRFIMNLQVI
jgi:hypothetical protein